MVLPSTRDVAAKERGTETSQSRATAQERENIHDMTWTTLLWFVGAVVAGLITFFLCRLLETYLHIRAEELRRSREALGNYEAAVDQLFGDPGTPKSLLSILEIFDKGVDNRYVASYIGRQIFLRGWPPQAEHSAEMIDTAFRDLDRLKENRAHLYQAFRDAIAEGFVAIMLRWPFPARAYAFLSADASRDPVTPARAVASASDHHNGRRVAAA